MQQIEKNIAFLISQQFPAIFRESGPELVALIQEYYVFVETQENQSHYVARRLFEYRDISTTLESMLIFFQKKYMADLPFKQENIRIAVKNIVDLYRRKGTKAGIQMFFSAFYQEEVEIYYPSKQMFKPSNSQWRTGTYLQMFPNDRSFSSLSGIKYTYNDLIGRNITGSASKAKAAVNKVNFIQLNGISTAIIYLDSVQGTFTKYDDVESNIKGEVVLFGRMNGSLSEIEIDETLGSTTGNKIGDTYDVVSQYGINGTAIITDVSEEFTGEVLYTVADGGYGYSVENTRLLVSDQVIILNNPDLVVKIGERIGNTSGDAVVIGQNTSSIGVRTQGGTAFSTANLNDVINTLERGSSNIALPATISITSSNNSSPGLLSPDTGNQSDVRVNELENTSVISVITDVIGDFASVTLNSADYGMSGAGAEDVNTTIGDAFDLTVVTIGSIKSFANLNPGSDYINDVFVIAEDDLINTFDLKDQTITVLAIPAQLSVGDIIEEISSNIKGIVRSIDAVSFEITVTPYDYNGFSDISVDNNDIVINRITGSGGPLIVTGIGVDFNSKVFGENATIKARTQFAIGKITAAAVVNSGFGYTSGDTISLVEDGEVQAEGFAVASIQGKTAGFWGSLSSHINGFIADPTDPTDSNKQIYYDSNMRIQDSDFFQEYSYQIKSMLGTAQYEELLKQNVHLAGTKLFGEFSFKAKANGNTKQRFARVFNDDGISQSPLE